MINNKMTKKIIILIVAFLVVLNVNAQGKYGADEQKCKENLSLYREYYKQKNYADALASWRWAYNNCPQASGNIYKNGPKIIKERMKLDTENKSDYIDTLMMIFDQRIQYFGKEGYVLGLKGYELLISDKKRSDIALEYLTKSISIEGIANSVASIVPSSNAG